MTLNCFYSWWIIVWHCIDKEPSLECHPCLNRPAPRDLWVIPLPSWNPPSCLQIVKPPTEHPCGTVWVLFAGRDRAIGGRPEGGLSGQLGEEMRVTTHPFRKANLQTTLLNCGLAILLQCLSAANYWRRSNSIITCRWLSEKNRTKRRASTSSVFTYESILCSLYQRQRLWCFLQP